MNASIKAYFGRKVIVDAAILPPKNYKVKNTQDQIQLPYEKYVDKNEEETYKIVTELVIHNMGWGYTCFSSAYMIFFSEKEIKVTKSEVITLFSGINTLEKF